MTNTEEGQVRALYQELLAAWNRRDAHGMAEQFTEDGIVVGFDGSQMNGQQEIQSTISQIFSDHPTAPYIAKVREVRFLTSEVAVIRAVVGMVPPGQADLNPAVNAVQTVVAVKHAGRWRITVFQNTPAALHGRPDLSEALTEELREVLRASRLLGR